MTTREIDARAAARRMLQQCAVSRPEQIDLDLIAASVGAEIICDDLDGATASVMRIGDHARIRVSRRIRDLGARRFSIAHELGHLQLGHEIPFGNARHVVERICKPLEKNRRVSERTANVFASEVVMPEPLVRPWCAASYVTLDPAREIANTFRTSILASAMRFVELSAERCAVAYSLLGRVQWIKRSSTFPDWIPKNRRLDPTSAACDYYQTGSLDPAAHVLDADAWLPRDRLCVGTAQIVEQSAAIPELGAVFTMLWIPCGQAGEGDVSRPVET